MPAISIRPACAHEYPALARLYAAAVRGLAIERYTSAQCEAWATLVEANAGWHERLASLQVWLAERDNEIAGFIAYSNDGHIDLLFTSPGHARRSVATTLYSAAEQALRLQSVSRLHTEASLLAQPFFSHQGYRIDAEESVTRNGVELKRFAMSKTLTDSST